MSFRPLHDRVLVEPLEAEEKTAGGIIVAAGKGLQNDKGEVRPLDVKVGDSVLYGKWSGTEVKVDGKDLVIMKESDILGIVE